MFCTKCGKNLSDSALFCSGCGAPTHIQQPAAQPVQAPARAAYTVPVAPAAYTSPAAALKKKKSGLIIGLAVGVPVLAVIITLAVAFLPALLVKKGQCRC